ncbi:MAG: Ni/Fe-hydrogenase cytochrome b subunit [Bacteroidetes bacterium]|nr:Ni/Fe-hydrogenase cytochrome b subunit [Bacteroidota bacterium]
MSILLPKPMKYKFFTPGVIVITIFALVGIAFVLGRFVFGIGAITNLDNQYPWGIWIGLDVALGVALAAGGFTTAALAHIFHKEEYETIVRPALLTALLGYTFAAASVSIDIGRWYYIWHALIYWNGNSALFEVGICVMMYLTVLYIEFLPIVTERFIGHVNLPGILSKLNNVIDKGLRILDRTLSKFMFVFIITGVVLSCLHQSSLGTLMIIAGDKMHPLWQTPILPLLYLVSAIGVGFPMVMFESVISSRAFRLKPETHILEKLSEMMPPLLGVFIIIRSVDILIREAYVYLAEFSSVSIMFSIELIVGFVLPLRLFMSKEVRKSPNMLFIASSLVIFGVFMNRFNTFITAYTPPYADYSYFPSIGEISVTLGFVALEVLLYRAFVMIFPVISVPTEEKSAKTKYAIRGILR